MVLTQSQVSQWFFHPDVQSESLQLGPFNVAGQAAQDREPAPMWLHGPMESPKLPSAWMMFLNKKPNLDISIYILITSPRYWNPCSQYFDHVLYLGLQLQMLFFICLGNCSVLVFALSLPDRPKSNNNLWSVLFFQDDKYPSILETIHVFFCHCACAQTS